MHSPILGTDDVFMLLLMEFPILDFARSVACMTQLSSSAHDGNPRNSFRNTEIALSRKLDNRMISSSDSKKRERKSTSALDSWMIACKNHDMTADSNPWRKQMTSSMRRLMTHSEHTGFSCQKRWYMGISMWFSLHTTLVSKMGNIFSQKGRLTYWYKIWNGIITWNYVNIMTSLSCSRVAHEDETFEEAAKRILREAILQVYCDEIKISFLETCWYPAIQEMCEEAYNEVLPFLEEHCSINSQQWWKERRYTETSQWITEKRKVIFPLPYDIAKMIINRHVSKIIQNRHRFRIWVIKVWRRVRQITSYKRDDLVERYQVL